MRSRSVFAATTLLATVAAMSSAVVVAQTSKEWRQCTGGEGPIADVVISGCSAVIQARQDVPRRLATAYNNRGWDGPHSLEILGRSAMQNIVL
jgi:hypothetical protein